MDQATPSAKIKEPREKLNATPEDVYSLLGYSWGERRQIITGLHIPALYLCPIDHTIHQTPNSQPPFPSLNPYQITTS